VPLRGLEPGERAQREPVVGAVARLLCELHRLGERRRRDAPAAAVELDTGEANERVREHVGLAGIAGLRDQPSEHLAGARVPARDGEGGAEVGMRLTAVRGRGIGVVDQRDALVVVPGEEQCSAEQQRRDELDAIVGVLGEAHRAACQTHRVGR
jgi:hypothetical protein